MILPIVAYGAEVLRKVGEDITPEYPGLSKLIEDMWETMYASNGVGLAAPQINRNIRLFVVDSAQIFEHQEPEEKGKYADEPGIKQVFINAHVVELDGEEWPYNEGCLSIPRIREDIMRPESVTLEYMDENIEGMLFIDYLKPLKRKLLHGKLTDISKGKIKVDYKMMFNK
jgi:peptide deformylase